METQLAGFRRRRRVRRGVKLSLAALLAALLFTLPVLFPRSTGRQKSVPATGVYLVDHNGRQIPLDTGTSPIDHTHLIDPSTLRYDLPESPAAPVIHTLVVPRGHTFALTLSDGTVIRVNSGSSLAYPAYFLPQRERSVELIYGELFLEVAPDEHCPFLVRTPLSDTKVLGTRFNVQVRPGEHSNITLVQGSVAVKPAGADWSSGIQLYPGENAEVSPDRISVQKVDVRNYTAWIDGYYYFDRKTVNEILEEICMVYDYRIGDPIPSQDPIRFWFDKDEDIHQVIVRLCKLAGVEVQLKGNVIVLKDN